MGQPFKYTEPTIWALRKKAKTSESRPIEGADTALYTHLFGYDPILVAANATGVGRHDEAIRRGSADNPALNIINPTTNFMVKDLASDDTSKA